jgi:MFS family permease
VSLAGTWMQQIAMVWLAYRLTGSALVLGVGFASQIPILVFSAFGGVITDRFDRRRLLIAPRPCRWCRRCCWPAGLAGMATPAT